MRLDIPGTLAYLESVGETGMAEALRKKLHAPAPFATGDAFLDAVLNAYQSYFKDCFAPTDQPLEAAEQAARQALTARLGTLLDQPGAELDALEKAIRTRVEADGRHFLGGTTQGYCGPYLWETTTRTDYDVEIPSGTETVTVFWMDGLPDAELAGLALGGRGGRGRLGQAGGPLLRAQGLRRQTRHAQLPDSLSSSTKRSTMPTCGWGRWNPGCWNTAPSWWS